MDIVSVTFFAFAFSGIVIFHALPSLLARRWMILVMNAVFLYSQSPEPYRLIPLLTFLLFGYGCVWWQQKSRSGAWRCVCILAVSLVFIYLKQYALACVLPQLAFVYTVVGLSYILFRILHLLVDVTDRAISGDISLLAYLNYVCFFPGLLSGPIQRFQEYRYQEERCSSISLSSREVHSAFSLIVNGLLKIVLVSGVLNQLNERCMGSLTHQSIPTPFLFSVACLSYLFFLFFNFSGYMNVVIGIARFFGFTLPENFNNPFASQNFLDFWSRWHITLSEWFKCYVFNPVLKLMTYRWGSTLSPSYLGTIAFFLTFVLMGIWHGTTKVFIIYGLFLGFGVSTNKLFEVVMRNRFGKKRLKALRDSWLYALCARGLALGYFAVALTCIWTDSSQQSWLLSSFGPVRFTASAIFCVLVLMVLLPGVDVILSSCRRVYASPILSSEFTRYTTLGFRLFLLVVVCLHQQDTLPPFVYKAF